MRESTLKPQAAEPHLPGETGVWMFIIGDVVIFSLFFGVFIYYRAADVALYAASQLTLNQVLGAFNTVLLLSSSWFVALAVHAARHARARLSARLLVAAAGCGIGFVIVKYFEWSEKIGAGYTLVTNDFFMYYFLLTGIHLLHVLIGIGVLSFLWSVIVKGDTSENTIVVLESGASFWHLVDILWIALFALLYLMR
ncbi:MAG: cytochrome c oxidase subunit 3 [Pseudomonadota bacterium]